MAGFQVARIMDTAYQAIVGIIIGAVENLLPLFRQHFSQRQGQQIAGKSVAAGVGVWRLRYFANRMKSLVCLVRTRTRVEFFESITGQWLFGVNSGGKSRRKWELIGGEPRPQHGAKRKDRLVRIIGLCCGYLGWAPCSLNPMKLSQFLLGHV